MEFNLEKKDLIVGNWYYGSDWEPESCAKFQSINTRFNYNERYHRSSDGYKRDDSFWGCCPSYALVSQKDLDKFLPKDHQDRSDSISHTEERKFRVGDKIYFPDLSKDYGNWKNNSKQHYKAKTPYQIAVVGRYDFKLASNDCISVGCGYVPECAVDFWSNREENEKIMDEDLEVELSELKHELTKDDSVSRIAEDEKWYISTVFLDFLCYIKSKTERYGINTDGYWYEEDDILIVDGGVREATTEEVRGRLLKYAEKNYPEGTIFKSAWVHTEYTRNGRMRFDEEDILDNNGFVFYNHKWAKIVEKQKVYGSKGQELELAAEFISKYLYGKDSIPNRRYKTIIDIDEPELIKPIEKNTINYLLTI